MNADGSLDTRFGPDHDGWAFVAFDQGGSPIDEAQRIAVDDAGRILLVGYCRSLKPMRSPRRGAASRNEKGS